MLYLKVVELVKFVKILSISLKTGRVTRRYPLEESLVTPEFRGEIRIDPEKCIGCWACTNICPPKALTVERDEDKAVLKYFVGRCIFCGMCADTCPQKAITVTREFELASFTIEDLKREVVHKIAKCTICGKPFVSSNQANKINNKINGVLKEERASMCPDCRRKQQARSISGRLIGVEK